MAGQLEHQILTHALNRNTYGDVRGAVLENLMQRGKFKFNAIFLLLVIIILTLFVILVVFFI